MRQSVFMPGCKPNHGFLFNRMAVDQASDSMTALTLSLNQWVGA